MNIILDAVQTTYDKNKFRNYNDTRGKYLYLRKHSATDVLVIIILYYVN